MNKVTLVLLVSLALISNIADAAKGGAGSGGGGGSNRVPTISQVTIDIDNGTITVLGSNFVSGDTAIRLAGVDSPLTVDGTTSEASTVRLPDSLPYGDYLLTVTTSGGTAEWQLTYPPVAQVFDIVDAVCPLGMVRAGDVCIDKYEASIWQTSDAATVELIRRGQIASAIDLTSVATQRGANGDEYDPGCPNNASGCLDYYAISIPGVLPSKTMTWFQAAATCRNSGKRLATNQEWQLSAFGTPDTGTDDGTTSCAVAGRSTVQTGSRSSCVSDVGAMDMVGNLWEWVADWWPAVIADPGSAVCNFGWEGFSDDYNCGALAVTSSGPAALLRGGDAWLSGGGTFAGPLAIAATVPPQIERINIGFRCARDL